MLNRSNYRRGGTIYNLRKCHVTSTRMIMRQTLAGLERSMTCVIAVGGRMGLYPGNSFDVGG